MDDAPQEAHREIGEALSQFSRGGYFIQHFWGMHGRVMAALYVGDPAHARRICEDDAAAVHGSGLMRIQIARVLWSWLEGSTAIAARNGPALGKAIKALQKEPIAWSQGMAALLLAAQARQHGEVARAQSLLAAGAEQLEALGATMYAAAARRARASLMAPEPRAAELATADAWFLGRGVKDPARFADAVLPGFAESQGSKQPVAPS